MVSESGQMTRRALFGSAFAAVIGAVCASVSAAMPVRRGVLAAGVRFRRLTPLRGVVGAPMMASGVVGGPQVGQMMPMEFGTGPVAPVRRFDPATGRIRSVRPAANSEGLKHGLEIPRD